MIRALAWWQTTRSRSLTEVNPSFSSSWRMDFSTTSTAKRNTALPSIWMAEGTGPGPWTRMLSGSPREPKTVCQVRPSSRRTTAAPAPSPKRTQVFRSEWSITRLMTSAPTIRAQGRGASDSRAWAVFRPYRKPAQAAFRSKQSVPSPSPSSRWSRQAVEGLAWSGVKVPTRHTPMSAAVIPARSMAWRAALAARSRPLSDVQKCR